MCAREGQCWRMCAREGQCWCMCAGEGQCWRRVGICAGEGLCMWLGSSRDGYHTLTFHHDEVVQGHSGLLCLHAYQV
jgi:hypothetical protein